MRKTKYVFLGVFVAVLGLWGLVATIPVSAARMNQNFQAPRSAAGAWEARATL